MKELGTIKEKHSNQLLFQSLSTDLQRGSAFMCYGYTVMSFRLCRLWAEIEALKWRDLELNLSKTVEELRQDSQLIQANSMKKLRDNKKLLECSFAQI